MSTDKLSHIDEAIALAEKGRGSAQGLVKASPIQIHIYNVFTAAKNDLIHYTECVEAGDGEKHYEDCVTGVKE